MDEAFIIMEIGNPDLDRMCDDVLVPAIMDAGFAPRRVDRHNAGDLLKSEVVQFIEQSTIIVADLTNERPNCYLEIGYAMGLGKKSNLILTSREDHHHGSPNYRVGGPKVHFDLQGYDILFWDPNDLATFRVELTKRISRRAAVVARSPQSPSDSGVSAPSWRSELRARGEKGLSSIGRASYMEISAEINPVGNWSQTRLLDVVREASIHTFGWPIAVVLDNRDEYRPRPTSDGIEAEIAIGRSTDNELDRSSYDIWKVFRDGRFYTLLSLFEDERIPDAIFFDTRINRVTESLLLLARVYRRLDASDTDRVSVNIRHSRLEGRRLLAANRSRDMSGNRTASEDTVEAELTVTLADLESEIVECVRRLVGPLFMNFDFFELGDEILGEIVDGFAAGRVS